MRHLIGLVLAAAPSFAFMIGNPGQPWLMTDGVIFNNHLCSLRAAFLDDYVYSQSFRGEFTVAATVEKPPIMKLASETGQVTLNLARRLDIYGILGSARLKMDQEVFGQYEFAWGFGAKAMIFQWHCLQVGCDVKYFETDQTPAFLVSSGLPIAIATKGFKLNYKEYQGALGVSYRTGIFCPYILGTYIQSKITPTSRIFLITIPGFDELMDASIKTFISRNNWGMAVGASLLMGEKGTLSIESRFINQNAIDASLELRF